MPFRLPDNLFAASSRDDSLKPPSTTAAHHRADLLPAGLQVFLSSFVRRERRLKLLRRLLFAATFVMAWTICWATVDRLFPLGDIPRWMLLCALGLVVALLLGRALAETWDARIDWLAAAARIERIDRTLGERLQTVASQHFEPPGQRGSAQLIDRLTIDVQADLATRRIDRLLPSSALRRHLALTGAAGLVLITLFLSPWLELPSLLGRQFAPSRDLPPVTTTRLVVEPGSAELIDGEPLRITADVTRLDEGNVTIRFGSPAGNSSMVFGSTEKTGISDSDRTSAVMQPDSSGKRFVYTFASVDHDFRYTVAAGDAQSPVYDVRVRRRPSVAEFRVSYDYPRYLGRETVAQTNRDGVLEAPRGSEAEVSIVATEPLRSAVFILDDSRRIAATPTADANTWQARVAIDHNTTYQIELISTHGVVGAGPGSCGIREIADAEPTVRWIDPSRLMASPRDTIRLTFAARDDFGLASMRCTAQPQRGGSRDIPVDVPSGETTGFDGQVLLNLPEMHAAIGDVIAVRIEAVDQAGQIARSESAFVLVMAHPADRQAHDRAAALQEAASSAATLAACIRQARQFLDEPRPGDPAGKDSRLARQSRTQSSIAGGLDAREQLMHRLTRAIGSSDSPELSTTLTRLNEVVAKHLTKLDHAVDPSATRSPDQMRLVLDEAYAGALDTALALRAIAHGALSERALADLDAIAEARRIIANGAATRPSTPPATPSAAQSDPTTGDRQQFARLLGDDIAAQCEFMGVEPDRSDLREELSRRVKAARGLLQSRSTDDLAQAARQAAGSFDPAKWNPPTARAAVISSPDYDAMPPEFQDALRAYFKVLNREENDAR